MRHAITVTNWCEEAQSLIDDHPHAVPHKFVYFDDDCGCYNFMDMDASTVPPHPPLGIYVNGQVIQHGSLVFPIPEDDADASD